MTIINSTELKMNEKAILVISDVAGRCIPDTQHKDDQQNLAAKCLRQYERDLRDCRLTLAAGVGVSLFAGPGATYGFAISMAAYLACIGFASQDYEDCLNGL